jgi:hypothetical protein
MESSVGFFVGLIILSDLGADRDLDTSRTRRHSSNVRLIVER